jgi:glycosyltransferase involved in cell wall biosynthesis
MRILLTTDTVGGVWTFTKELAGGLLRSGHSVALVSFGQTPSIHQLNDSARLYQAFPHNFLYEASTVPLEWMPQNKRAYIDGEGLLVRVARDFGADVFHSNQFCFGRLPISIPTVITAHSDVLSWAEACRPGGLKKSTWLSSYLTLVGDGILAADVITAPTRWMLAALNRNFVARSTQRVIMNGRTIDSVRDPSKKVLQAVSIGRLWDEGKNVSILAAIKSPVPIAIAGDTRSEQDDPSPYAPHLTFAGSLGEREIVKLLSSSSIYIATSTYEPFGLAPLEAGLCGCALLCNDISSFREIWQDAALYFKDADSLEALLHRLVGSPVLLSEAQGSANRRALDFTAQRMTNAYIQLYSELLLKDTSVNGRRLEASASAGELAAHVA